MQVGGCGLDDILHMNELPLVGGERHADVGILYRRWIDHPYRAPGHALSCLSDPLANRSLSGYRQILKFEVCAKPARESVDLSDDVLDGSEVRHEVEPFDGLLVGVRRLRGGEPGGFDTSYVVVVSGLVGERALEAVE